MSSSGGYAPNYSFDGMFKSSIKIIFILPTSGPNIPFLLFYFSNLDSIISKTYIQPVFAENAVIVGINLDYSKSSSKTLLSNIVFPVPVLPYNNNGLLWNKIYFDKAWIEDDSDVGTYISWNTVPLGIL